MFNGKGTFALVVALAAAVAPVVTAHAGEWVAPVPGQTVLLAFGAEYPGGTHRGLDLSAPAGSEVSAPAEGQVAFAGAVPADGGGTCGAVSVSLGDGTRVSLLPLDAVFVSEGDRIAVAEVVGTLAATGDDSSAASHLHVGWRRGDVYLDPTPLLGVAPDVGSGGLATPVGQAPPTTGPESTGPAPDPGVSRPGAGAAVATAAAPVPGADPLTFVRDGAETPCSPLAGAVRSGADSDGASAGVPAPGSVAALPAAPAVASPSVPARKMPIAGAGLPPASVLRRVWAPTADRGWRYARSWCVAIRPTSSVAVLTGLAALLALACTHGRQPKPVASA